MTTYEVKCNEKMASTHKDFYEYICNKIRTEMQVKIRRLFFQRLEGNVCRAFSNAGMYCISPPHEPNP